MTSEAPVPKKILVFGATGLIGKYILAELYAARSSFDKIGVFTSENTAKSKAEEIDSWRERGVEVIIGDVASEDDVSKAYQSYDTVVSALGRSAILAQLPLLALASAAPTIHTFYPSEYGTDIEHSPSSASEPPHQHKLRVREYIRSHALALHTTYLVTGPYAELFFAPASRYSHAGEFDPRSRRATLLGAGDERVSFTTMRDVGRLLVAALRTPSALRERVLRVTSFTTTPREALALFEKETQARWEVRVVSLQRLKEYEKEAWEKGDPLATVFTLRRIWTEGGTLYEKRDNGAVGFEGQEETLEEYVRRAVEKYA
ncbi:hypothetical protein ACN47E_004161 [Coniothyrium glycines]